MLRVHWLWLAAVNLKAVGVGMMTVLTVNTVITDCLTLQRAV
jgi:hypothetical protein